MGVRVTQLLDIRRLSETRTPEDGDVLNVAEVFGPTFQGEGPSRGRVATFIRTGACNLSCRWSDTECDSAFTWDASRFRPRDHIFPVPVVRIIEFLEFTEAPLLVVTGGEPLLHQRRPAFLQLFAAAERSGLNVEVETNGTKSPNPELAGMPSFNVSPKLSNNVSDPESVRIVPSALARFAELARMGTATFKFVISAEADLVEVEQLIRRFDVPNKQVWIMPEGVDPDLIMKKAQQLADPVLQRGWNFTLRDHRALWPEEDKGR